MLYHLILVTTPGEKDYYHSRLTGQEPTQEQTRTAKTLSAGLTALR